MSAEEYYSGQREEFLGLPNDEAVAGPVYDAFPRFEAGNQANRRACVALIAEAMRRSFRSGTEMGSNFFWSASMN